MTDKELRAIRDYLYGMKHLSVFERDVCNLLAEVDHLNDEILINNAQIKDLEKVNGRMKAALGRVMDVAEHHHMTMRFAEAIEGEKGGG